MDISFKYIGTVWTVICLVHLAGINSGEIAPDDIHDVNQILEMELYKANVILKSNWDSAIATAPMIVAVIGDLAIAGANADFKLETGQQKITQLQHNGYVPAIAQMGDYVHTALSKASRNTNGIASIVSQIEGHVRQVLQLLKSGGLSDLHTYMPINLKHLSDIATRCVNFATNTVTALDNAIILTKEIETALVSTKKKDVIKVKKMEQEKEALIAKISLKKDIIKLVKKNQKLLTRQMRDAQDAYTISIAQIPTGFAAEFQTLFANINPASVLVGAAHLVSAAIKLANPEIAMAEGILNLVQGKKTSEQFSYQASANMAETLAKFKTKCIHTLMRAKEGSPNMQRALSGNLAQYTDIFANLTGVVKNTLLPLKDTSVKNFVMEALSNAAKHLSKTKQKFGGITEGLSNIINEIFPEIDQLISPFLALASSGSHTNGNLLFKSQYLDHKNADTTMHVQTKNQPFIAGVRERLIAEMQNRQLLQAKDQVYKNEDKIIAELRETQKMVEDVTRLNISALDINNAIKLVKKAMDHLTNLQKMWNQMTEFFRNLVTLVNDDIGNYLSVFHNYSLKDINRKMNNETRAIVLANAKQLLMESALKARAMGEAMFAISSLYLNVSDKYVINQILEVTDYSNLNVQGRRKKAFELKDHCMLAKEFIENVANDQKEKLSSNLFKQISEVNKIFDVLGKPSTTETNAIAKGIELAERKKHDFRELLTI